MLGPDMRISSYKQRPQWSIDAMFIACSLPRSDWGQNIGELLSNGATSCLYVTGKAVPESEVIQQLVSLGPVTFC